MALNDLSVGGVGALPVGRDGLVFLLKNSIDCAENAQGAGDIAKIIRIPAGTWVLEVQARVKTAEGGTLTIDVGDYLESNNSAVDADGYMNDVDANAVASYSNKRTGTPAFAAGKLYTVDSYLGVLFNNAADAALIEVHVLCADCNA
jgi:hypothetical protein